MNMTVLRKNQLAKTSEKLGYLGIAKQNLTTNGSGRTFLYNYQHILYHLHAISLKNTLFLRLFLQVYLLYLNYYI